MGGVLVFAHGSLMFHAVPAPVVGAGRVVGWSRRFGHPSVRNWGSRAAPAPTCCLVEGGTVAGVLLRAGDEGLAAIAAREASDPVEVEVEAPGGWDTALTWTMGSAWAGRSLEELAELGAANVAAGGGPSGDALDYAIGVCRALRLYGLADADAEGYLSRLLARVRDVAPDRAPSSPM